MPRHGLNELRKDFTPSERVEIGRALEVELREKGATLHPSESDTVAKRAAQSGQAIGRRFRQWHLRAWRAKRKPATLPNCWPCWCWPCCDGPTLARATWVKTWVEKQKRPVSRMNVMFLAEAVRFELTDGCPSPVFKTGAIDHSATLPKWTKLLILSAGSTAACSGLTSARRRTLAWITRHGVDLLLRGARVAAHARNERRGGYTTVGVHLSAARRAHLQWSPPRLIEWGRRIGLACFCCIESITMLNYTTVI